MRLTRLIASSAIALSMTTAPVMAAQGSASALSLSAAKQVRASTKGDNESELAPAVIIGVLATAAIIGGAIALANNDDDPDSP